MWITIFSGQEAVTFCQPQTPASIPRPALRMAHAQRFETPADKTNDVNDDSYRVPVPILFHLNKETFMNVMTKEHYRTLTWNGTAELAIAAGRAAYAIKTIGTQWGNLSSSECATLANDLRALADEIDGKKTGENE